VSVSTFERILGVPLSRKRQQEELESHLRFRSLADLRATLSENISHITQKSGALLAAQAIFLVVVTYGIDHAWPQIAVVVSLATLVFATLLVMTNLRSIYMGVRRDIEDPARLDFEGVLQLSRIAGTRGARFNVALYLTFLSVVLLGFGAIEASLG
jgi:hypothetical protein